MTSNYFIQRPTCVPVGEGMIKVEDEISDEEIIFIGVSTWAIFLS